MKTSSYPSFSKQRLIASWPRKGPRNLASLLTMRSDLLWIPLDKAILCAVGTATTFAFTYPDVAHLYRRRVVAESRVVSPPSNSATCKRCGGGFQYVATVPKTAENDRYDILSQMHGVGSLDIPGEANRRSLTSSKDSDSDKRLPCLIFNSTDAVATRLSATWIKSKIRSRPQLRALLMGHSNS